jgi:hypothetical protein
MEISYEFWVSNNVCVYLTYIIFVTEKKYKLLDLK